MGWRQWRSRDAAVPVTGLPKQLEPGSRRFIQQITICVHARTNTSKISTSATPVLFICVRCALHVDPYADTCRYSVLLQPLMLQQLLQLVFLRIYNQGFEIEPSSVGPI